MASQDKGEIKCGIIKLNEDHAKHDIAIKESPNVQGHVTKG